MDRSQWRSKRLCQLRVPNWPCRLAECRRILVYRRRLHGNGKPRCRVRSDGFAASLRGAMVGSMLFKSVDGGATWSRRRFGTPAVYVIAVAVDPLSPNIVYAGTNNEGLFKSADYGDTWASVGTGLLGPITFLTIDPT